MIRLVHVLDDDRLMYAFGLTDVNVQRLTNGLPIRTSLVPGARDSDVLVLYHATRESCVELANTLGIDQATLLDQLGEG